MVQEKNINQPVPNYIYFMCMQKRDVDPRAAHIFARKEVEDLPWECLLLLRVGSIIQAGVSWGALGAPVLPPLPALSSPLPLLGVVSGKLVIEEGAAMAAGRACCSHPPCSFFLPR